MRLARSFSYSLSDSSSMSLMLKETLRVGLRLGWVFLDGVGVYAGSSSMLLLLSFDERRKKDLMLDTVDVLLVEVELCLRDRVPSLAPLPVVPSDEVEVDLEDILENRLGLRDSDCRVEVRERSLVLRREEDDELEYGLE